MSQNNVFPKLTVLKIDEVEKSNIKILETIGADLTPVDPTKFNGFFYSMELLNDSFSQMDLEDYDFSEKEIKVFETLLNELKDTEYLLLA